MKKKKRKRETKDFGCLEACRLVGRGVKNFFLGPPEGCQALKFTLGFPVGLLIAYGFYTLLIDPLMLPEYLRKSLGALLAFALALGFSLSVQVRCMIFLLFPMFFGKEGRSYVATFAIALIITGPIANIMLNARETTRALGCSIKLLANHTKAKMELRLKPLHDIALELQKDGFRMKEIMASIDKAFAPIRQELTDEKEMKSLRKNTDEVDNQEGGNVHRSQKIEKRYKGVENDNIEKQRERKYEKKLDFRCEDVFSMGVQRCRKWFRDTEDDCLEAIPVIGYLLCLPLKLTIVCELVRAVPDLIGLDCNSMKTVDPGLGETYEASEQTMDDFGKSFDVEMKYKVEHVKEEIDVVTAEEVSLAIEKEFEGHQLVIDHILTIFQVALGFAFILLFKQTYTYSKKYVSDFQFDNIYITAYFKRIDARRHAQGKRTLLPLKRLEGKNAVLPRTPKLRSVEKKKLVKGTLKLILTVFVVAMVIAVDRLLFTVLDIIQRHSHIEYRQTGVHEININVNGDGFVAKIFRSVLKGFNTKHDIDNVSTNFECLPKAVTLSTRNIWYIYGIYAVIWVLLLLEAYGLRLRRLICSFFYVKREKSRVLYLYNDLLKRRKGFLRHARRQIKQQAKKQQLSRRTGLLSSIRSQFPRLCSCLKIFESGKLKCLICEDKEGADFHRCERPGCKFGYCKECWVDIKKRCYACMTEEEFDEDTEESDDGMMDSDDSD